MINFTQQRTVLPVSQVLWFFPIIFLAVIMASDISTGRFGGLFVILLPAVYCFLLFLAKPELGLIFTVGTLPVSAVSVFQDFGITKIIGLLAITAWMLNKVFRKGNLKAFYNRQTICLTGFLLIAAVSSLSVGFQDTRTLLFRVIQNVGLFILTIDMVNSWKLLSRLLRIMVIVGVISGALNLALYFSGYEKVQVYSEVGVQVHRLEGIQGLHINTLAKLMVTLLPLSALLPFPRPYNWLGRIGTAVLLLAMIFTYSRGAMVAYVIVISIYTILYFNRRAAALILISITVFWTLVPHTYYQRIHSIITPEEQGLRPILFKSALNAFMEKPLFGWGIGQSTDAIFYQGLVTKHLESHNTLLDILVAYGLTGFILLIFASILSAYYIVHSMTKGKKWLTAQQRDYVTAIMFSYIAIWTTGMFMNLTYDPMLFLFIALCAAVFNLVSDEKRKNLNEDKN